MRPALSQLPAGAGGRFSLGMPCGHPGSLFCFFGLPAEVPQLPVSSSRQMVLVVVDSPLGEGDPSPEGGGNGGSFPPTALMAAVFPLDARWCPGSLFCCFGLPAEVPELPVSSSAQMVLCCRFPSGGRGPVAGRRREWGLVPTNGADGGRFPVGCPLVPGLAVLFLRPPAEVPEHPVPSNEWLGFVVDSPLGEGDPSPEGGGNGGSFPPTALVAPRRSPIQSTLRV